MQIDVPVSLGFTNAPTPIVRIKAPAGYNLWMKRDDMTGLELSGNKIRKLDFLVKQAIDEGADGIITCGGLQSNHCRAAAYLSQKVNLDCILFLRGIPGDLPTGNHLLNLLTNAKIHYVSADEYQDIDNLMDAESISRSNKGKKFYVIPEGGSNATGAWGYCQCFFEITDQIKQHQLPVEAIVVATGSGGTHAGLLVGKLLQNSKIEILSVNVCDDASHFRNKIASIISDFKKKYTSDFILQEKDIHVFDGFVGGGYGEVGSGEIDLIKRFAREEGIILDPVYTAKAFFGLENLMKENKLKYKNILFIHTGGVFGLFPYAEYFV